MISLSLAALLLAVAGGSCLGMADEWSEMGRVWRVVGWLWLGSGVLLGLVGLLIDLGVLS